MLACWGGCTSSAWIKLQKQKLTVGALTDVTAQRLYSVSPSLLMINHGSGTEEYKSESDARQEVLLAIISGSTPDEALESAGEGAPSTTNLAVEAVIDVASDD